MLWLLSLRHFEINFLEFFLNVSHYQDGSKIQNYWFKQYQNALIKIQSWSITFHIIVRYEFLLSKYQCKCHVVRNQNDPEISYDKELDFITLDVYKFVGIQFTLLLSFYDGRHELNYHLFEMNIKTQIFMRETHGHVYSSVKKVVNYLTN